MHVVDRGEVTSLLAEYAQGNCAALEVLIRKVYPELRRMAQSIMFGERPNHTLSATALVHEGFLRLFGQGQVAIKDSRHFFLTAATVMQHVLTDHARKKLAGKRNGEIIIPTSYPMDELVAVGELVDRLEASDARAAEIVRLRFYMGLTVQETGKILGIAESTVHQNWRWARAWLRAEIHGGVKSHDDPGQARSS